MDSQPPPSFPLPKVVAMNMPTCAHEYGHLFALSCEEENLAVVEPGIEGAPTGRDFALMHELAHATWAWLGMPRGRTAPPSNFRTPIAGRPWVRVLGVGG